MAKRKGQFTRREMTLQQAKADAQKSVLGIFVESPYYIHSNEDTWHAAENAAMQQLQSYTKKVRQAVIREFNVLKQIIATREANLFSKLNNTLSDNQIRAVFKGPITRKNFIAVLQEVYSQTDIVLQVASTKEALSKLPRGNKTWGQLQRIIAEYEKLSQTLNKTPDSFDDTAIALRLQKLCAQYHDLQTMNAQTNAMALALSKDLSSDANMIKIKDIENLDQDGEPMSNLFGLGKNYLQQTVFPSLYEIGLTQAGMMLCQQLGLNQIENRLVAKDTQTGTSADSVVFNLGISVKSTNKIHQVKSRALDTFLTPLTMTESDPALNQVYQLAYGQSDLSGALSYLLLNHSVLGLTEDNVVLILKILSWMSLNEKLFGYNKRNQLLQGMTLQDLVQTMPIFTFVGADKTFIYMGDLLNKLANSVLTDFDSITKVVHSKLTGARSHVDQISTIKALKHSMMVSIVHDEKRKISYKNIKRSWLDQNLQELNNQFMKDLSITLSYTFDWKKISKT